ncbi:MAG TPA: molybdenum ABC transporter ATP-binding protein [Blastocatellia bacterium]|nr:molybdenum ABC transporter ATP-binding protein [Blastocatellia bacterium]
MVSLDVRKRLGPPGGDGFALAVAFDAPAGVTILFGPSGAGKSTLLDCIAGLTRPDAGRIVVGGEVFFDRERGVDLRVRERRVGYVFQNLALFPHLTVAENVAFGLRGRARAGRQVEVSDMLGRLRIAHTAGRRPGEISGGEAQRAALARALVTAPRLLLLDEPFSALDAPIKRALISDLKELRSASGLPVIYVTHSRDEALALGDEMIVLEGGHVAARGTPLEIFSAPARLSEARLAEVDNLFRAAVVGRDPARGEMILRLAADCRLAVPLGDYRVGDEVTVAVPSGDILVAAREPAGLSARNLLRGRVTRVETSDGEVRVIVDCGVPFVAALTRAALDELGLAPGRETWLVIKAHACHVLE